MFHKLWKWARWRHPTKGERWIKRKYFRSYKNSKWRFRTEKGQILIHHNNIHIKRHKKVQGKRSPYDGDIEYWKKRQSREEKSNDMKRYV